MCTIRGKEFDYQAYTKKNPPDSAKIRRGSDARKKRFESAKKKVSVSIDEDILEHFLKVESIGRGYEKLINQALREWLSEKKKEKFQADGNGKDNNADCPNRRLTGMKGLNR